MSSRYPAASFHLFNNPDLTVHRSPLSMGCVWDIMVWALSSFLPIVLCSLHWRQNEWDGVSNYRRLDCLLNRLFRRRSKKTSKVRVIGLCEGNSSVTDDFPAQRASDAKIASIWWRHDIHCHAICKHNISRVFTYIISAFQLLFKYRL